LIKFSLKVLPLVHSIESYAFYIKEYNTPNRLDEETFLSVFEGVPTFEVKKSELAKGIPFSVLAAEITKVFPSKGELRRLVQGGGLSINKQKVDNPDITIGTETLLNGKYILVQKGKKNYSIILAVD